MSELLDRPVSVQEIDVKPYTLELTVSGFRIGEKKDSLDAAETFVSFDKLYIDLSSESITQRAPVISTVTLDTLRIRLSREGENQLNISDLIEKFSQPSEDEDETATLFSVSNIVLKNGHIEWVDHFKQNHQEISKIGYTGTIIVIIYREYCPFFILIIRSLKKPVTIVIQYMIFIDQMFFFQVYPVINK